MSSATRFVMGGSSAGRFSGKPLSGGGAAYEARLLVSTPILGVGPSDYYIGQMATVLEWPAIVGTTLPIYGVGDDPTVDVTTPFGDGDKAVTFNNGKRYFYGGGATDLANIGSGDAVIELLYKTGASTSPNVWTVRTYGTSGWYFKVQSAIARWFLRDGSGNSFTISSSPTAPLVANTWYHIMGSYRASTNEGRLFVNGVSGITYTDVTIGTVDQDSKLQIGYQTSETVAAFGFYKPTLTDVDITSIALARAELVGLA